MSDQRINLNDPLIEEGEILSDDSANPDDPFKFSFPNTIQYQQNTINLHSNANTPPSSKRQKKDNNKINNMNTRNSKRIDIMKRKPKNKNKHEFINKLNSFELDTYDEFEMLCVRGCSPQPLRTEPPTDTWNNIYFNNDINSSGNSSSDSNDSFNIVEYEKMSLDQRREYRRNRYLAKKSAVTITTSPNKGVCKKNILGKCHSSNCTYVHAFRAPRNLKLCKNYYSNACSNSFKCLYMHSDFPCKYYYLGMKNHVISECKFSHGKPISNEMQRILLHQIETAPQHVFGRMINIPHDNLLEMMKNRNNELINIYNKKNNNNMKNKCKNDRDNNLKLQIPTSSSSLSSSSASSSSLIPNVSLPKSFGNNNNLFDINQTNLKELINIIPEEKIYKLMSLGINNVEQINQLTVAQLHKIGLSIPTIDNIQNKLLNFNSDIPTSVNSSVFLNTNKTMPTSTSDLFNLNNKNDVDMRIFSPQNTFSIHHDVNKSIKIDINSDLCSYTVNKSINESFDNCTDEETNLIIDESCDEGSIKEE